VTVRGWFLRDRTRKTENGRRHEGVPDCTPRSGLLRVGIALALSMAVVWSWARGIAPPPRALLAGERAGGQAGDSVPMVGSCPLIAHDPFRARRAPAPVAYDPVALAAGPPLRRLPKPVLTFDGEIAWGAEPEAVIEGLPSTDGPRVVRQGRDRRRPQSAAHRARSGRDHRNGYHVDADGEGAMEMKADWRAAGLAGGLAVLFPGRRPARPPARQDTTSVRVTSDSVSVRFVETDLRAVIQALSRYLPKPVLVGQLQPMRVSLETPGPVNRAALVPLIKGLVESQNLAFTEDSSFYRITRAGC